MFLIVSSTLFVYSLFSVKTLLEFIGLCHFIKPKSKVHHRAKLPNVHVSPCNVTVRVVCAVNIPIAEDT